MDFPLTSRFWSGFYTAWGFLFFLCVAQGFVFYSAWPWSPFFYPCLMHLVIFFYYFGIGVLSVIVLVHPWWCFLSVPLSWGVKLITFYLKGQEPYMWVANWSNFLFTLMVLWPLFFLLGFYVWILVGWFIWWIWIKK